MLDLYFVSNLFILALHSVEPFHRYEDDHYAQRTRRNRIAIQVFSFLHFDVTASGRRVTIDCKDQSDQTQLYQCVSENVIHCNRWPIQSS